MGDSRGLIEFQKIVFIVLERGFPLGVVWHETFPEDDKGSLQRRNDLVCCPPFFEDAEGDTQKYETT